MELRICIDVDDMARALSFYVKGLGLCKGREFDSGFVVELLGAGCPVDLLLNRAGSSPIAGSVITRNYQRHWTPVHLDIVVDNIEASVARLLRHGALLESPVAEHSWGKIAGLVDPFGHGLDLLQFNALGYDALVPK
ncbi:MAG: VOC family protein [Pseudomonadota bacterium]